MKHTEVERNDETDQQQKADPDEQGEGDEWLPIRELRSRCIGRLFVAAAEILSEDGAAGHFARLAFSHTRGSGVLP
ncbi:MAG: hypothetical protein R3315_08040 [Woeseiaceae bacterium]|nr:hypothetical protein [Woeseiaceae bacterium]